MVRVRDVLRRPLDDLLACIDGIARGARPQRALAATALALVVSWLVYVPVHELLHVLGCVAAGGSVSELQIAPVYGGALWARIFPFVVSGAKSMTSMPIAKMRLVNLPIWA